jgi:hypothetical protein
VFDEARDRLVFLPFDVAADLQRGCAQERKAQLVQKKLTFILFANCLRACVPSIGNSRVIMEVNYQRM